MTSRYLKWKKSVPVRWVASVRITVACLVWLFVLTFWGTVAQVSDGLYQAQEKFFHSWYFLQWGFLPLPGAQLTLWILFVNLSANAVFRFVYRWANVGILIIHLGLLSYFVGAFVTLHGVEESNLTLREGETSNVAQAYHDWELAVWSPSEADALEVTAFDVAGLKSGEVVTLTDPPLEFGVRLYFANAQAYTRGKAPQPDLLNVSGINDLSRLALDSAPERNFPGGIFTVRLPDGSRRDILLYGQESQPTPLAAGGKGYLFQIRRKRYQLPITVTLKKFEMEKHPGTEIARSYRSYVQIERQGIKRDAEIYMNHPYRFKDYTFYQASYAVDQRGEFRSTLAVVRNEGRLLPYVSSLVTFAGLAVHFLVMAFRRRWR
ncbi:MAG: cytochrome c biogenesis protein ResB [Candidatus Omnitrophica bacterium]|nr:cytochrome c biogenesis protein ResB [Candidatus Omnitrophota bacterium]MCB9722138.1 cytochrome c biogenesis protein ResB [Candidatus Omnitrophota bacterium]